MVSPTMMASENNKIGEVTRPMNSMTSILAILETNTLCATPGLRRAGVVEQTTAAAAIAGLNPDLIKIGIMEGPTAAPESGCGRDGYCTKTGYKHASGEQ